MKYVNGNNLYSSAVGCDGNSVVDEYSYFSIGPDFSPLLLTSR